MTSDVGRLCAELNGQPLFHLSLHSKELFHSNFLGWLCEAHSGAATRALKTWLPERNDASGAHIVLREKDHLDLAVQLPGCAPFVLENKVFSPPDEAQLDKYAAGKLAGLTDPVMLLLSLGDPSWPDGTYTTPLGAVWRHLSFEDLRRVLDHAHEAMPDHLAFDRELVARYRDMVVILGQLASSVGRPAADEPIDVPPDDAEHLRAIRLHDAIGKLRARSAIAAARAHTESLLPDIPVQWEADFTKGSPLMSAFVEVGDGDRLGWQYQHKQWRAATITRAHDGRGPALLALRHEYVTAHYADWFVFDGIRALTGRPVKEVPRTEADGRYCSFAPNFTYRYRKLPALTQNELVALSHHYIEAAASRHRTAERVRLEPA